MNLFEATWRQNDNFWTKLLKMYLFEATWRKNAKFLVKVLVKNNKRNSSIHCNKKGGRARSARAPWLFPSPLLLLLFSLTKILTKNLTKHLTKKLTLLRQAASRRYMFGQF